MSKEIDNRFIPVSEVQRFAKEVLIAVGTPDDIAAAQASLIAETDRRGYLSHGLTKLEVYVEDILNGVCDSKAKPAILKESDSTAWVHGNNGLGAYVGMFCMDKAIEKAKKTGVGWVTCKHANYNGMESFFTLMALKQGMIGLAFSNHAPMIVPTRAKSNAIGTNPLSMAAPGKGKDYFLLDISTAATSLGKIELYKKNKWPLPVGWALDNSGQPTTDADFAFKNPNLVPLGGSEENSGYKGTGLSMFVDILCGISSGSKYGPHIARVPTKTEPANLGQCYIAVNPKNFTPGFEHRMSDQLDHIRNLAPADPHKPVLVPGDIERKFIQEVQKHGGIQYFPYQIELAAKLSSAYGIEPLRDKHGYAVGVPGAGRYVCESTCAEQHT